MQASELLLSLLPEPSSPGLVVIHSITLNSSVVVPGTSTLALLGLALPVAVGVIRRRKAAR